MQGFLNIREPWDAFELSNKEFIWKKYAVFWDQSSHKVTLTIQISWLDQTKLENGV